MLVTNHYHSLSPANNYVGAWIQMWDSGQMDGACGVYTNIPKGCSPLPPQCPQGVAGDSGYCAAMTYVQNTVWNQGPPTQGILDPYFYIANQYGWANYMFQTNQGPSFPAHQFLFSGTSAPIQYNELSPPCGFYPAYPCYQWFDAELTLQKTNGCTADCGVQAQDIDPGSNEAPAYTPGAPVNSLGFPCYDHSSLPTLLDAAGVTWKYYARTAYDLWTAPTAINPICQTTGYGDQGGVCGGTDWINNVGAVLPDQKQGPYKKDSAPFLTDITNCNLSKVSWVIPDGNWSDHNGYQPGDGGPSWVAAIVNAIGGSGCTDMVNGSPVSYWQDTVILITWDDWGGLYDDVLPPDCPPPGPCTGYANSGTNPPNGAQYVYGFRVPLLVVSAYAKPSYISGPPNSPSCPNYYCHDFGSILNFIEYAFGTGGRPLGGQYGIGDSHWPYADYFAPDGNFEDSSSPYSLSDFFNFGQIQTPTFTTILGAKYQPYCFHTPTAPGCFATYPVDPDDDATGD